MSAIVSYMSAGHRHCDDLFADAENAVSENNWTAASAAWEAFCRELESHLQREELVLFPAFEEQTGSTQGPTAVMRQEHIQMRALVQQMTTAVTAQDTEEFLGGADTLQILISQHNMKEEQILYPMSDQAIQNTEQLVETMQSKIA